ncbi:uncharacterized protein LOC131041375 isoform X1 [Cryptomeria japonica]|uniref:uncharacterized protein LOC131041375 isoform X1 n=1 Tax=Cryptomeria japonica TaxID=3369 RepID=UPI0027D9DB24|nr:uncharacterized protein LOC131041375 isoform X1 [Cryptomeria japonica]
MVTGSNPEGDKVVHLIKTILLWNACTRRLSYTKSACQYTKKTVFKQGVSTSFSSPISKNNLAFNQKSSKRWKPMMMDYKSAGQACCSASSTQVTCSVVNVRCSAEQQSQSQSSTTQTIQRQSSEISNAPSQEKEKTPELDDGGDGGGPGGDGGGGGGGGGGGWFGGFFFFGFLAFLGLLKDNESEKRNSYVE